MKALEITRSWWRRSEVVESGGWRVGLEGRIERSCARVEIRWISRRRMVLLAERCRVTLCWFNMRCDIVWELSRGGRRGLRRDPGSRVFRSGGLDFLIVSVVCTISTGGRRGRGWRRNGGPGVTDFMVVRSDSALVVVDGRKRLGRQRVG